MNGLLKHIHLKAILQLLAILVEYSNSENVQSETTLSNPSIIFAVKEINNFFRKKGDYRPRISVAIKTATKQPSVQGEMYKYSIELEGADTNELCYIKIVADDSKKKRQKYIRLGTIKCQSTDIEQNNKVKPKQPLKTEQQIQPVKSIEQIQPEKSIPPILAKPHYSLTGDDVQKVLRFLESSINVRSNSALYLKVSSANIIPVQNEDNVLFKFLYATLVTSNCTQGDVKQAGKLCSYFRRARPLVNCTLNLRWRRFTQPSYIIYNETCYSL